ncbi:hypothetical protein, partial [Staphylococcus hominis]|uniref:hypothetical protein n=1 Tax=Staphylococcus hominis TaxID=1290 RepID=UPI001643BCEA
KPPLPKQIQQPKPQTTLKQNNYINNQHNTPQQILPQQNAIKHHFSNNLPHQSPQPQQIQQPKKQPIPKHQKQQQTHPLAAQRR